MSIPILLDARHLGPGMGELLDLCDVVIGSERFAAEIAHSSDIGRCLIELTKMGPRIAVVTLGEEGAVGLEGEKLVRQGAIEVDIQDTSGASDVFRGAFAYALVQGWPLERSLPFANAAAGPRTAATWAASPASRRWPRSCARPGSNHCRVRLAQMLVR